MQLPLRPRSLAILLTALAVGAGCYFSSTTRPASVAVRGPQRDIRSPLKAHMMDGSVVVFAAGATITTVAVAALSVAIFGSCPTIYADSAGTQVLQAESFSNSIAPLLAPRDLDRLVAVADPNGIVRLDVRNEAVETHYIEHLELVEYRHRADELALPAPGATSVPSSPPTTTSSLQPTPASSRGRSMVVRSRTTST